jgi:hypothetical protein
LGTVQQFYVPFEMFPTQWAFLPWIILFSLKYLQKNNSNSYGTVSNRSLLFFAITTILATPQAYAAHLWYPFFGLYCLFLIIHHFSYGTVLNRSLHLILLTLALNSFWLLPNIYYASTSSQTVKDNTQNRLHSQEFLLKNRQNGILSDTSLNRGFYFDWDAYDFVHQTNMPLMPEWLTHLKNFDITLIGVFLFFIAIMGFVASIYSRDPLFIPLTPFLIIPFVILSNRIPSFSNLFDLLLKNPILAEILRFVFTKFSIVYTFGISLFAGYFIYLLFSVSTSISHWFSLPLLFCTLFPLSKDF